MLLQVESNVGNPCFAVAENGLRPCSSRPEVLENNNAAPQGCPSVLYALIISFYSRLAFAYPAKPLQILSASTLCTNTVSCIASPASEQSLLLPADVAQPPSPPTTAADDKPEAPVIEHTATAEPETAEHYSDPAQASTSGPSTMVHTDSAEHNRVAQSDSAQQSLEADTGMREHDTGVQSSSSKADSLAADNSSASKKRAVDADYSVSGAESKGKKKAGAASAVKMPAGSAVGAVAEPSSQAAAAPAEHNHPSGAEQAAPTATASAAAQPAAVVTAAATDAPSSVADAQEGGMEGSSPARSASSSSLNVPPAFLPPKPKPGGNKVKTVRPSHEASSAVEQPQVLALPPQQPLSAVEQPSAPAPQQPPQQASGCCRCCCCCCCYSFTPVCILPVMLPLPLWLSIIQAPGAVMCGMTAVTAALACSLLARFLLAE